MFIQNYYSNVMQILSFLTEFCCNLLRSVQTIRCKCQQDLTCILHLPKRKNSDNQ